MWKSMGNSLLQHYPILANYHGLFNPVDRGAWWVAVHRVTKRYVTQHMKRLSMHWRRKWQPTPVFLPGESQRWRSLVGCRLWGRTQSDTTEATQQQQHFILKKKKSQLFHFGRYTEFVVESNSGKELFKLPSLSGQEQCRIPLGRNGESISCRVVGSLLLQEKQSENPELGIIWLKEWG